MAKVIKDEEVFVATRHHQDLKDGIKKVYHKEAKTKNGRYSFKDFMGEKYLKIIEDAGVLTVAELAKLKKK